ncbi:MAG: sigma-70 family RNA polymerase sigma factor [Firmicutes bacterium]|nr:sigma-70 family RNA polymerase sigma factor [Bacillota bacterium]
MEKTLTTAIQQSFFSQLRNEVNAEVFAEIFDLYYSRIYNYMHYRSGSTDDAEELTSQVFEKILKKLGSFNPEKAPFEVWIFTIARNSVNDYYRCRNRWRWFSLESVPDQVSPQPSPEEAALKNEDQVRLRAALRSLGDRERDIIAMKFAGGLKNREIARLTGLSESNVGVVIYRTLHQLRAKLESGE